MPHINIEEIKDLETDLKKSLFSIFFVKQKMTEMTRKADFLAEYDSGNENLSTLHSNLADGSTDMANLQDNLCQSLECITKYIESRESLEVEDHPTL